MKAFRWLAAAGLATILASGCGGGADARTADRPPPTNAMEITLNGNYGPETAGIVMADKRGYFADAGLDVNVRLPIQPYRPIPYIAGHATDMSITHEPELVLAQDKDLPVVAVGNLISQPTAAMIWLDKSGIGGIAGLRGKTIAFPGLPFQRSLLEAILRRSGMTLDDVKLRRVGFQMLTALITGQADAIFGGSAALEGAELEAQGLKPVVTPVEDLGVPSYDELMLIVHAERLDEVPVRRFLAALARGNAAVVAEPDVALRELATAAVETPDKAMRENFEATLPLLSKTGTMDPEQASRLVSWMHDEGLIEGEPSPSEMFTDDFLPPPP